MRAHEIIYVPSNDLRFVTQFQTRDTKILPQLSRKWGCSTWTWSTIQVILFNGEMSDSFNLERRQVYKCKSTKFE